MPRPLRSAVSRLCALLPAILLATACNAPTPAATAAVDGDPSQISQIVLNLCLNANEAMPRPPV